MQGEERAIETHVPTENAEAVGILKFHTLKFF